MMENKDKPAFPINSAPNGHPWEGITKYEWFLAHASEAIPEWFRHSMEEFGDRPKDMIYPDDYFRKSDRPIFKNYNFEDEEWNFPIGDPANLEAFKQAEIEIKEYTAKFLDVQKRRDEWDSHNKVERYFQWRKFYALKMCELC